MLNKKTQNWYINAVRAELVANYALSNAQAKKFVASSPLKKALKKYPDEQLHVSVDKAAREVLDYNLVK
jgi:hypothetical protein